jgi:DNA mismatch endonuclease (patch repair protein)
MKSSSATSLLHSRHKSSSIGNARKDRLTAEERSHNMSLIRAKGNSSTELKLITAFRKSGIKGWRRHPRIMGRPDFIFRRQRLLIFVDGCFWHSCPNHGHLPHGNVMYWRAKLKRNRLRDQRMRRELRQRGWRVVRLWEHDLTKTPDRAAQKIARLLLL